MTEQSPTLAEPFAELERRAHAFLNVAMCPPYWECAYYRRGEEGADPNGSCSFGCVEEPECQTGGPWTEDDKSEFYEAHSDWQDMNTAEMAACAVESLTAAADRLEALEEVARLAAPVVAFALPNRGMGHPDVMRLRAALAALTQEDK